MIRRVSICTVHRVLLGCSNQGGWDGRGMHGRNHKCVENICQKNWTKHTSLKT
jgi:hypothetical protein